VLFTGYFAGVVVGLATGVACGYSRRVSYWVDPFLKVLGAIPSTTWIPVVMVIAASLFSGAVFIIALGVWFAVTIATATGIKNIDPALYEAARTLGANTRRLVVNVAIPSALPSIFQGMIQAMSSACTALLVGKTVGLPDGIGNSDQNISMRYFNKDGVDINSINWKAVTSDAVVQALQSGEIQAANISDQFAYPFVADGTLRAIRSITTDEDFKNEPCCVVTFNSAFFQQNPVTAKKFVRAFSKASQWTQDNKEEFVDILFENSWSSGDKDVALDLANKYNFVVTDSTTETALRDIITDYKKFGVIESQDDVDTILKNVWAPVLA
jgi:ABC-type nitrate/sulfonate/bicarbonate transport system substrate-binding protein